MKYTKLKHHSHPHILKPETSETPFTCDGCREAGWGLRFSCADCNYDLHKDCALSVTYITHPFYENCSLKFRNRGLADTCCDACGKLVLGFVYNSGDRSLHPSCAKLNITIQSDDGIELHLQKKTWSTKCGKCQSRNWAGRVGGWSYRSADKVYHFQVSCVKDMVQELVITRWEREHVFGNINIATVIPELVSSGIVGNSLRRKMKNTTLSMVAIILNLFFSIVLGDPIGVTNFFTSLI